jgi:hypothetical protein
MGPGHMSDEERQKLARRSFLEQCGRFAVATPPVVSLMLTTGTKAALAASGRTTLSTTTFGNTTTATTTTATTTATTTPTMGGDGAFTLGGSGTLSSGGTVANSGTPVFTQSTQ